MTEFSLIYCSPETTKCVREPCQPFGFPECLVFMIHMKVSHGGIPKSSKSLDHLVLTPVDLGISHFKKPPYIDIDTG